MVANHQRAIPTSNYQDNQNSPLRLAGGLFCVLRLDRVAFERPKPWPALGEMHQARILTARAATSAIVSSEIVASAIISSLARCESGKVSVGENAVALVKARKK